MSAKPDMPLVARGVDTALNETVELAERLTTLLTIAEVVSEIVAFDLIDLLTEIDTLEFSAIIAWLLSARVRVTFPDDAIEMFDDAVSERTADGVA